MPYSPPNQPNTHPYTHTPQDAEAAKAAGAAVVGADDLVKAIQAGELNFDRCVATPEVMPLVSRVARVGRGVYVHARAVVGRCVSGDFLLVVCVVRTD